MTLAGISLKTALQACWLLYVGWETTWAMLMEGPARSRVLQRAGYFSVHSLEMLLLFCISLWSSVDV